MSFQEVGLTAAGTMHHCYACTFHGVFVLALRVLNFGGAKWLEDAILHYSAEIGHTKEYRIYSYISRPHV